MPGLFVAQTRSSGPLARASRVRRLNPATTDPAQGDGAFKGRAHQAVKPSPTLPVQTLPLQGASGPPAQGLPDMNVIRHLPHRVPRLPQIATPPRRHPRLGRVPRNGRRVGDPLPSVLPTPQATPAPLVSNVPPAEAFGARAHGPQENAPDADLFGLGPWPEGRKVTNHHAGPAPVPQSSLPLETWYQQFYERVRDCSFAQNNCPASSTTEQTYWLDVMRTAHPSTASRLLATRDVGRTLFDSAAYRVRPRSDSQYVEDLYWAYLRRAPDGTPEDPKTGWGYWTQEAAPNRQGREAVRRAFDECGEFAGIVNAIVSATNPSGNATNVWSAKQDLLNATGGSGVNPISRNFAWSLPFLSLPGRAGLDLGLTLSYNSLVWTKSGPYAYFDEENGSPSPGFRIGFPTLQGRYFNPVTNQNAYLLLLPDGSRVELRQVDGSGVYEDGDSSYLQLLDTGDSLLLRATDGTQMNYAKINDEWRCTQVKDRNGNYLSVTYKWWGQIDMITDTLGRIITFQYYNDVTNQTLYRIKQTWKKLLPGGAEQNIVHIYAQFEYEDQQINPAVPGLVVGTGNSQTWPLLKRVRLANNDYYEFGYFSGTGQIGALGFYAWNEAAQQGELLNNQGLALDTTPEQNERVQQLSVWGANWNTATTSYDAPASVGNVTPYPGGQPGDKLKARVTLPDNTKQDVYFFANGWQRGLVSYTETRDTDDNSSAVRRWTTTTWEQDNANGYRVNPRVIGSQVGDPQGNNRRVSIAYTSYGLPSDVTEYQSGAPFGSLDIVFRRTHTDYRLDSEYVNRRIIGLTAARYLFEGGTVNVTNGVYANYTLLDKTTYDYDWPGPDHLQDTSQPATQHDRNNYGPDFVFGRGNLVLTKHFDVTQPENMSSNVATEYQAGYYVTGTLRFSRDPLGRQTTLDYTDNFSITGYNGAKFAYPKTVTDAGDFRSTVEYNYDFGGITKGQGPPPNVTNPALQEAAAKPVQRTVYDDLGRVERVTVENTGAYTRYY